jgi:gluconate 2-dehydrogenase gamma chain
MAGENDDRLVAIGINRRQLIVRLAASSVALTAPGAAGAEEVSEDRRPKNSRDPADPDLNDVKLLWEKLLTIDERATVAALCDVILPADARSPAPSSLNVHDFIDEWVSAPYPKQLDDRQIIRGGLAWLNRESERRFRARFTALAPNQKIAICDDIADHTAAAPRFRAGARFFQRMRHLTMLGFYTTPEGMKDLGYVGNVAATEWKGPSDELLRRLALL